MMLTRTAGVSVMMTRLPEHVRFAAAARITAALRDRGSSANGAADTAEGAVAERTAHFVLVTETADDASADELPDLRVLPLENLPRNANLAALREKAVRLWAASDVPKPAMLLLWTTRPTAEEARGAGEQQQDQQQEQSSCQAPVAEDRHVRDAFGIGVEELHKALTDEASRDKKAKQGAALVAMMSCAKDSSAFARTALQALSSDQPCTMCLCSNRAAARVVPLSSWINRLWETESEDSLVLHEEQERVNWEQGGLRVFFASTKCSMYCVRADARAAIEAGRALAVS